MRTRKLAVAISLDVVGGSRGFRDARGAATFTRAAGSAGPPARRTGGPEDNPRRDPRVDVDLV